MASANHPGLQIISAKRFAAELFAAGNGQTIRVPASCRVVGVARPTADSEIGFELWLPDEWNGRYAQLGNGGFAGNIDHPSLAAEIRRGNAAAVTDTGHKASQFDASWALGHPEKIVDYGYRSIKVTADAARLLIAGYYGRSAKRRYFIGCSNGGRQALMAAQRYPDDWDGIIAGSPPVQWTRQLATFAAIQHRLRGNPQNWIPPQKLPMIQNAAIAACGDAKIKCRIDVSKLACRGDSDCLTPGQTATLDLIQTGLRLASSNGLGFDPRYAAVPGNWDQWIVNPDREAPSDLVFGTQAYRYFVYGRADWQVEDFQLEQDVRAATDRLVLGQPLGKILDPDDPDLARFAKHGGRLIMYVGTADAVISPAAGIAYYESLERQFGAKRVEDFARLFVVPGMQHCQGGPEPSSFGQAWVAPALRADAEHDVRLALEAWVERGQAPSALVAAKADASGAKHIRVRRLLPYGSAAYGTD